MDRVRIKGNPEGTRVCSGNIVVSTGIPSLDTVLGGGLPLGTITLVEEDLHGGYAKTVLQYFLAEGVVNKHSIFAASNDKLVKNLPDQISADPDETKPTKPREAVDENLKIAFRYQNLPTSEKEEVSHFGHYYDLSKTMPSERLDACNITSWKYQEVKTVNYDGIVGNEEETKKKKAHVLLPFINPVYGTLLDSIKNKLKSEDLYSESGDGKKTVLRIALHNIGSPIWIPNQKDYASYEMHPSKDLDKFFFALRVLLRSVPAVAMITVPSHLYKKDCLERIIHSSDIVMQLQSFGGTEHESNPCLSDYHGFFILKKLAAVHSAVSKHPGSVELAFKQRRKKFVIEKLHLPPDLQDDNETKRDSKPSLSCGSSDKHLLDF